MIISADTKIAALLKQEPSALEVIISISKKFEKLRNPVLRKMIAGRTSIRMAAKLGACSVADFFKVLEPLGFEIDRSSNIQSQPIEKIPLPDLIRHIPVEKITELDVRPLIETDQDPLSVILKSVNTLNADHVLKLITTFEPTPLMVLLGKRGFESYADVLGIDLVHTWFYKTAEPTSPNKKKQDPGSETWDEVVSRFTGKLEVLDVRNLAMPLPMHNILTELESLGSDKALFVYHKRIPVYLIPELEERNFRYRIKEQSEGDVQLVIYRP